MSEPYSTFAGRSSSRPTAPRSRSREPWSGTGRACGSPIPRRSRRPREVDVRLAAVLEPPLHPEAARLARVARRSRRPRLPRLRPRPRTDRGVGGRRDRVPDGRRQHALSGRPAGSTSGHGRSARASPSACFGSRAGPVASDCDCTIPATGSAVGTRAAGSSRRGSPNAARLPRRASTRRRKSPLSVQGETGERIGGTCPYPAVGYEAARGGFRDRYGTVRGAAAARLTDEEIARRASPSGEVGAARAVPADRGDPRDTGEAGVDRTTQAALGDFG